jgi:LysM repeat protein
LKIHMVKKNDTLFNLANKYNVELDAIIAINPQIQDPNKIDVGMKVKIPSRPQPVEPPSSEHAHKHIVKQGDSLWKLGKAWDIPLQTMIKANPQLKNPNVLMTGEIVYIPKLSSTPMYEAQGNKVSTMPYPQAAPMQAPMPGPEYPMMPQHQMPYAMPPQYQMPYAMPQYEGPTGDISAPAPAMPSSEDTTPPESAATDQSKPATEEPSSSMPSAAPQDQTKTDSPDLSEPYQQAQHPFAQFHLKATEVLAYSEPFEYGGEATVSNIPEMPPTYGGYQPIPDAYSAYQTQPAYHVKDCGCGGGTAGESYAQPWNAYPAHTAGESYAQPWNAYPAQPAGESYAQPWNAYPAHTSMEMPYSPYQMEPGPSMFPYSTMPAPCYPMTGGEFQPGFTYGAGHPGAGHPGMEYPYPASPDPSHSVQQAHIHQWAENQAQEEQQDREASTGKNISKSSGKSAKVSKKSNSRKQQLREDKLEQKTNIPWINV